MLELEPDMQIVAEASDGEQALNLAISLSPDIVITDIKMPRTDGIELLGKLRERKPECRVIVLTFYETYLRAAVEAGAAAYLQKDVQRERLVQAIRSVREGRFPIHLSVETSQVAEVAGLAKLTYSQRELATLRLVAAGMSTREVATQLSVSEATVKRTLRGLFDKLGSRSRAEAVAVAVKRNLL